MIGKRVGLYEIVDEIGRGGMATVYRAYQPNVDRFVAVKIIHQRIAFDRVALERFQREARLIAKLEHPHLLPVYDYDGLNDPPYIVMRYLESGTLKDILDKRGLPLNEIAFMMRQVTSALDYAHRQGVIHRDIKPSNIMVDQDGNAFLTDFGIAHFSESGNQMTGLTQTGFAVGTPGYMSPEQGLGTPIDKTTDIYALGVMVFQMATGQMPYSAETPMAVVLKHIQESIPSAVAINPELPEEFDEIIQRAMAKKPDERYTTGLELSDALTRLVGSHALTQTPQVLRQGALEEIKQMQMRREEHGDEISKTMNTFSLDRDAVKNAKTQVFMEDSPTTPYGQRAAVGTEGTSAEPPKRRPSTWVIIAAVVAVVIIGGLLFLLLSSGDEDSGDDVATLTAQAVAVLSTDTDEPEEVGTQDSGFTDETEEASATRRASNTPEEDTSTPTNTNTPSDTPTPTATDTPRPTPATPIVEARRDLTIRLGPGAQYPDIGTLPAGDTFDILGISEDGVWYQVLLPNGESGWVLASGSFSAFSGNRDIVQVAAAPSETATETLTPTNTPTRTPTETFTRTPTDTPTETNTPSNTPTETPSPTNTPTESPTATLTPTLTPSDTPTLTPSPTNTPSETPTLTPTETIAPTQTPPPTATPIPAGRLPFVADFENANPLDGWDINPQAWQVVNEGGQSVLVGQGVLDQIAVVLGRERPEWLEATASDFVVSFKVNMDTNAGGIRLVYRYQDGVGYNVLEAFPGLILVRRSNAQPNPFDRNSELVLRQNNRAPISGGTWHEITLWVEGSRHYVYLDRSLILTVEDLNLPQLGAGQIFLQANSAYRTVRFDDIIVQRAEPYSDHFEAAGLPRTWATSDTAKTSVGIETDGNQYIYVDQEAEVYPVMSPIRDFTLHCRVWSNNGGYILALRDSDAGRLHLDMLGGNMSIIYYGEGGEIIFQRTVQNFYTRNTWQDLQISFNGSRLEIYLDGRSRYEDTLPASPNAGTIRFITRQADIMQFDDCLLTQAAGAINEGAAFAYELIDAVNARGYYNLLSDFTDDFNEIYRSRGWWVGGLDAPGEFVTDPADPAHQNYLQMTSQGVPVYRIVNGTRGTEMFGAGSDRRNYTDSTDLLVSAEVNFPPDESGNAWLAIRAEPNLTGSYLNGYFVRVRKDAAGRIDFQITYEDTASQTIIFEGLPPGGESDPLPAWIPITAVMYRDRMAFFINGRFVTSLDNVEDIGGSVALGVEADTVANFDTLIMRDTTPFGR